MTNDFLMTIHRRHFKKLAIDYMVFANPSPGHESIDFTSYKFNLSDRVNKYNYSPHNHICYMFFLYFPQIINLTRK